MNRCALSCSADSMGSAIRKLLILLLVLSVPLYFAFFASEGILVQIAGAVFILLLLSLLLFTGRSPLPMSLEEESVVEDAPDMFSDVELPPPVLSEMSAGEARDQKIKRSRGRSTEAIESPPPLPEPPLPMPPATADLEPAPIEGSPEGLAEVYVAVSDPEMQQEAEVEQYLAKKKAIRESVRDRITRERRMEMSKRIAEEASRWTDAEDGEDISTLLKAPGHGLAVFAEPEHPDPDIPQGISYVRIDDERVIKVRVSMDVQGPSDGAERLPDPGDLGIPGPPDPSMPMPPPPGMPPPPVPDMPPPVRPDE